MYYYEILQDIMDEKGLSIPEVARMTNLPDSTIRSVFDRRQKRVSLDIAFKMAEGFGVSLERLNGMKETDAPPTPFPEKLRAIARQDLGADITVEQAHKFAELLDTMSNKKSKKD